MIKPKMEKAINEQINAEFYSAYLYLSMSAYCERSNLSGFANWMYVQFQEEMTHAMKFYRYLNERSGNVALMAIKEPPAEWQSPLHIFEETLKHEQYITGRINDLVDLVLEEKDHATNNVLQWFVAEQVEEEASAESILEQIRMVGDSKDGLLMLDKELGQRTFVDPTQNAKA